MSHSPTTKSLTTRMTGMLLPLAAIPPSPTAAKIVGVGKVEDVGVVAQRLGVNVQIRRVLLLT